MARHVQFSEVRGATGFSRGTFEGTVVDEAARLRPAPAGHAASAPPPHRWTSAAVEVPFPATEAILSWHAITPPGTWIELELSVRNADGSWTAWFVLARWTERDDAAGGIRRTTVSGQRDADASVHADTFVAAQGRAFTAYRLRVTFARGDEVEAEVDASLVMVGAMVSAIDDPTPEPQPFHDGHGHGNDDHADHADHDDHADRLGARGMALDVPRFSQQLHRGARVDLGGGGEAWCSPTSTAMVLGFWDRLPSDDALTGIEAPNGDPQVVWAAAGCYDHGYAGTGNWAFNAAFAARNGLESFVTRLRSLDEAERFIAAGIPLIASVAFTRDELPEAGYVTEGHLLVIAGFTVDGDVVVNDPAAPENTAVRRSYPRAAFERAWLRSAGGSGGVVYVMRPADVRLPAVPGEERNW
ncbi:C39 family peptidase [Agromyces cerinus]|uniref:Peptidase_C39 like family protein n=1 Tax=Agromyces cerinus subsp. cerinus TaxID=232089 RepID=A0A1N6ELX8_9MICO|nr:C39 family peptidase [Agromyces cerinus]SIN84062.1 Peptidase_C39 like family protein [Agromyces cerinus subsp. cerinus]